MENSTGTIGLKCRCGALTGTLVDVARDRCIRLTCTCADCQRYARYLGRADLLDRFGGTEIVQSTPSRVRLDKGKELLRSVRLYPRGLVRWYADCCKTPIANTAPWARLPFVGIPFAALESKVEATMDSAMGPNRGYINTASMVSQPDGEKPPEASPMLILRTIQLLATNSLAGRARPNPFFDASSGQPISPPQILSDAERSALA